MPTNKKFAFSITYRPHRTLAGVLVCSGPAGCGSLVEQEDQQKHTNWHNEVEKR